MEKDISQVEFFMPNGSTKKYVVGEDIDGRTIIKIREYDSFIRISLFEIIETPSSYREDIDYLRMPTSIPYSLSYTDVKPWYAQPRY